MSDKRTFQFPSIKRNNPEAMQERAFKVAELFEEFGIGVGKFFNPKLPTSAMTFEKNGVKVVFTISGLNDNTVLVVATRADKTTFKVGSELDFEKFKEKLVDMYDREYRHASSDMAAKDGRDAIQNAIDPYLKQITMTASKFGFESRITVAENSFTIELSERRDAFPYRAKLKFNASLRFESVSVEPITEHINGFDYEHYDKQKAQMKNVENFEIDINQQLTQPPVKHSEEVIAEELTHA